MNCSAHGTYLYRCPRARCFPSVRSFQNPSSVRVSEQSHGVSRRPRARLDSVDKQRAMDRRDVRIFLPPDSPFSLLLRGAMPSPIFCEYVERSLVLQEEIWCSLSSNLLSLLLVEIEIARIALSSLLPLSETERDANAQEPLV